MNKNQNTFSFQSIGYVKSPFPDKFGVPRQSGLVKNLISEICIFSQWQPELAFQGLEGYSHLWVHFIFHLNSNSKFHPKVHPPRLKGETIGVFATRSPHRPNPVGLSLVEIVKVENNKIYVKGLDLVDNTPIIDIKPYLPQFECIPSAQGGWATQNEHKVNQIQVQFANEAQLSLTQWKDVQNKKGLQIYTEFIEQNIVDLLKQDPRPIVYRGYENAETSPYRNEHAMKLYDLDIHFKFSTESEVLVFKVECVK